MLKLAASALLCFALAMPTVAAAASPPPLLGQLEGQAWSTLLATPVDQYPLADPCLEHPLPPGLHTFTSHFEQSQPAGPPQSSDESFQVQVVPGLQATGR
jgi:hypothetical protein